MGVEQYSLVAHDWLNLEFIINDLASRVIGQELSPGSSPTWVGATFTGKINIGSQASPVDVTATRKYGVEFHFSGDDYDVTTLRARAQLVTTDTTATAQGALLQAANNDGINAGVLQGALIEAIGKSDGNAATIAVMRGALVNTEWDDYDTVTDLKTLHVRTHSRNATGAGSFGTGYGIYIENEAVGGNGQAYDAGIYFKGTNLSAGNKAFTYGIDFSGGTYGTAEMLIGNAKIASSSNDITLQPITDSTTFFQIKNKDGNIIASCNTVNNRWGFGTASPGMSLEISKDTNSAVELLRLRNADITYSQTMDFSLNTNKDLVITGGSAVGGFIFDGGVRGLVVTTGNVGFGETAPETLTEWTSTAPYLTLHNSTHEDTDGGGESRLIFKREDGAGTETACFQFEASHDGAVANDQLGKGVWSVNTGSGLVEGMRLDTDGLTVTGSIDLLHTATVSDDHAFEIDVDAAGYGDVKAINIDYITGAIATGEDEGIILININEIAATGGDVFGIEILATEGAGGSTTTVYGLKAGALVGPIHQDSGTFANPAIGTNDTPQTPVANMIDGDSGPTKRTSIFVALDDYIIIGATVAFQEIEFIITTGSSGAGIKPKFEYSTGGSGFTEFSPVDGTNGFRNTGVIAWDAGDLVGHAVNADTGAANTYDIRITRERTNLSTSPILGYAKVAATIEYIWDENGNVNINSLTLADIITKGPWFDVRAYGTVGNGVTDDTVAVQAAIDAASVASGGAVFFPVGTYLCDTLTLDDDVTLLGADKYNSIIELRTAETNLFTGTSKDNISFKNIALLGANAIPTNPATEQLMYLITSTNITIENCYLASSQYGVHLETCTNVIIRNNHFYDMVRDDTGARGYGVIATLNSSGVIVEGNYFNLIERSCVYFTSGTSNSIMTNNVSDNGTGQGFVVSSATAQNTQRNIIISGNTVNNINAAVSGTDVSYGILINGNVDGVIISNNGIYDVAEGGGIFVQHGSTDTNTAKNIIISQNIINNIAGGAGIGVTNGSRIQIINNQIKAVDVTAGVYSGISVQVSGSGTGSFIDEFTIKDNQIDTGRYGIILAGIDATHQVKNTTVTGNRITNATTSSFNFSNSTFLDALDIHSNYFDGSQIVTLGNNATPSVILGAKLFLTGGTTTITDFDDGFEGQIITIIAEHSLDITDGTNIFLSGSATWSMTATDTLTLIQKADGKWYEIARSDSGV